MTEQESAYSKVLPAPPRHSILPPLIQTPGGEGREHRGPHVRACSHAARTQRVTVTPFPQNGPRRYVRPTWTQAAKEGGTSGLGFTGWKRDNPNSHNISCCLCLPFHCLHGKFQCATISCRKGFPHWAGPPRKHWRLLPLGRFAGKIRKRQISNCRDESAASWWSLPESYIKQALTCCPRKHFVWPWQTCLERWSSWSQTNRKESVPNLTHTTTRPHARLWTRAGCISMKLQQERQAG